VTALALAVEAEDVTPGLLGFLVVAALAVATWLLIRSMNRQIRRIDLPDEDVPGRADPVEGTDDSAGPPAGGGGPREDGGRAGSS
jgi:hypothetical protein